jgi:hypothetical protein
MLGRQKPRLNSFREYIDIDALQEELQAMMESGEMAFDQQVTRSAPPGQVDEMVLGDTYARGSAWGSHAAREWGIRSSHGHVLVSQGDEPPQPPVTRIVQRDGEVSETLCPLGQTSFRPGLTMGLFGRG